MEIVEIWLNWLKTSRERPKSALYLRLKIVKGGPFGLCETPASNENMKKKWGRALWGLKKISQKILKMRFLNSVTVSKNVKGGTLWDFLTSIVLQNVEKNEGGTLWCNPSFKKSRIVPKKVGLWGILSVISRFWTSVLFLFVLDALLRLELLRLELLRFDVVEQMNKKVDLTRLKKSTHCKSRAHFLKCAD